MSIMSEMLAEQRAKLLEKILYNAIEAGSDVVIFIKEHIYPLYLEEIATTWELMKVPDDIEKMYGDK